MDVKQTRKSILFALLTTALLGSISTQALAARPTLANEGPKVQRGLKVGDNSVRSFVYNEQRSIPAPLKHRIKLPVYLIVTNAKGKETKYTAYTRPSTFAGGNPPVKESVRWDKVKIPHAGKYILTVEIPKSDNPIIYSLSRNRASVSKSYAVGGGNGKQPPQSAAGYDLTIKLKQHRGTRGAGYWVYLYTPKGKQIGKKRTPGSAQVTFKDVAALKVPYRIEVKAANRIIAKVKHRMPKEDDLVSIEIK